MKTNHTNNIRVSEFLLVTLLAACGGGGGTSASNTPADQQTIMTATRNLAPASSCPNGGVTVDSGIDTNHNRMLDSSEVTRAQHVCNGGSGLNALVLISNEPAGVNCANGGKKVDAGQDSNSNGILDPAEITTSAYVCNGTSGNNGTNGLNSLMSIVPEPAGAFCTYGGNKVSSGLDSNANGILDPAEITASNYVCNGAPGATGATGPAGAGITWTTVTDTTIQAVSNTSYIANNNTSQVTITLPVASVMGDEIRVSGLGAGGWKVAQNAGQYTIAPDIVGGIGETWTQRMTDANRDWRAVASSADGIKLIAAECGGGAGGYLYTSTDAGVTWIARDPVNKLGDLIVACWVSVASSADGTMLVAVADGGRVYTSSNSGVFWAARDVVRNWVSVASSSDGTKLVAAERYGKLYTSSDSGVTWTPRAIDTDRYWNAVASSADGTKLVAGSDQIFTSTDSGVTWSAASGTPARRWNSVASSSDGSKLIAVPAFDQIYISTDAGGTWTANGPIGHWWSVASSADGTKLIAGSSAGSIIVSVDSGTTWTSHLGGTWAVAASADGTKLIAADGGHGGGLLYSSIASTTPGTAGSISGVQYDSLDLLCINSSTFMVRGHSGNLVLK